MDTVSLKEVKQHKTIASVLFDQIKSKPSSAAALIDKCKISSNHLNLILRDLVFEGKIILNDEDNYEIKRRYF